MSLLHLLLSRVYKSLVRGVGAESSSVPKDKTSDGRRLLKVDSNESRSTRTMMYTGRLISFFLLLVFVSIFFLLLLHRLPVCSQTERDMARKWIYAYALSYLMQYSQPDTIDLPLLATFVFFLSASVLRSFLPIPSFHPLFIPSFLLSFSSFLSRLFHLLGQLSSPVSL